MTATAPRQYGLLIHARRWADPWIQGPFTWDQLLVLCHNTRRAFTPAQCGLEAFQWPTDPLILRHLLRNPRLSREGPISGNRGV